MSRQHRKPAAEAPATTTATDEPDPRTVVAEPVVIDLRDGVDTVAAYEADRARRTRRA
ncbi:MAG TPA: hypothetical protein VF228_14345 [Iamia sp.]